MRNVSTFFLEHFKHEMFLLLFQHYPALMEVTGKGGRLLQRYLEPGWASTSASERAHTLPLVEERGIWWCFSPLYTSDYVFIISSICCCQPTEVLQRCSHPHCPPWKESSCPWIRPGPAHLSHRRRDESRPGVLAPLWLENIGTPFHTQLQP